jgi:PAS domain S-box-containing protein
MFGYEIDEVMNDLSLADLVHPDDLALVTENIRRRIEDAEATSHYTFRGLKKDGSIISVEVHGASINYHGMPGFIGSLLDNTEKERAQEQLRQAQKLEAIGRLSGGIAHDINNLLTPILGLSEILAQNPNLPEKESRMLDQMTNAACRARDLIGQLLAFSRKQVLKVEPFDLNQTLNEYYSLIRRTLRENIKFTVHKADDLKPVLADQGQIEQVLMNLVVNAADAMPEGGSLTIKTAMMALDKAQIPTHSDIVPGNYAMLGVHDTGQGMNTEPLSHIFEPFYSTKGDEGTGLGLETVYGIVKQHKGTIRVQSEPDQGTTFKVFLPVTEQSLQAGKKQETGAELEGTETILVVEDNDLVRITVCAILEQGNYQVVETENGTEALECVKRGCRPDLLLTDVIMPDINGKIVYSRIKEQIPSLKVLYMSGYTDDIIAQQDTLDAGVHFIQKPFGARAVLEKIRAICDS